MSTQQTEAAATATEDTEAEGITSTTDTQAKPTETVDFWKQKAREQEKRAKDNAAAAQRLLEIENAQKSEAQKAADAVAAAEKARDDALAEARSLTIATEFKLGTEDAGLVAKLSDEADQRALAKRLAEQVDAQQKKAPSVGSVTKTADASGSNGDQFAAFFEQQLGR